MATLDYLRGLLGVVYQRTTQSFIHLESDPYRDLPVKVNMKVLKLVLEDLHKTFEHFPSPPSAGVPTDGK